MILCERRWRSAKMIGILAKSESVQGLVRSQQRALPVRPGAQQAAGTNWVAQLLQKSAAMPDAREEREEHFVCSVQLYIASRLALY